MLNEKVVVGVSADTTGFDAAMESLTDATERFGEVFASTISRSIQSGKSFEDILRSIGKRFSDLALKKALDPVENLFSGLLGSFVGGGSFPSAGSGATGGSVLPFAKGGVVSSPTMFGFGERLGVMGEAGAEAIMPLARGSDGRLGVAASEGAAPINVNFNIATRDAASFRKSEGQVTAMLARAVRRGQRGL